MLFIHTECSTFMTMITINCVNFFIFHINSVMLCHISHRPSYSIFIGCYWPLYLGGSWYLYWKADGKQTTILSATGSYARTEATGNFLAYRRGGFVSDPSVLISTHTMCSITISSVELTSFVTSLHWKTLAMWDLLCQRQRFIIMSLGRSPLPPTSKMIKKLDTVQIEIGKTWGAEGIGQITFFVSIIILWSLKKCTYNHRKAKF